MQFPSPWPSFGILKSLQKRVFLLGKLARAKSEPWIRIRRESGHWQIDVFFANAKRNQ